MSKQATNFTLYGSNWLVFITVVESVYSAVRTDSLYKIDYVPSLKGSGSRPGVFGVQKRLTFNAGIKSLPASLPAEIFYWDFNF
jgi:hypothetical protein